jgi:hypothetical protein
MTLTSARRLVVAGVVGVALAAAVVGVATAGSRSANRAASRRDARSLLAKLALPAGATWLFSEPHGDHAYLKAQGALEGDEARTVAHGWWEVPGIPGDVIAYIRAHPPTGGTQFGTGAAGNIYNGTSADSLYYQWPGVRGVLGYRELAVTATALPDGETGVLAEAQSDWIVPRPTGERIPSSTAEIDIASGTPRQAPSESFSVSTPSEVRKIVRLINGLPIAQPIVYNCPALTDPRFVRMTFRAATEGPALAVLTYYDFRPWAGPSNACKTVDLTIAGRRQDPLIGGDFLQAIGRMLGRSLI